MTWTPVPSPIPYNDDGDVWPSTQSALYPSARTFVYDDFTRGAPNDSIASRVGAFGTRWYSGPDGGSSTRHMPVVSGVSSIIGATSHIDGSTFAAVPEGTDDAYPDYMVTATFRWLSSLSVTGGGFQVGAHGDTVGHAVEQVAAFFYDDTENAGYFELDVAGAGSVDTFTVLPQIGVDYPCVLAVSNTSSGVSVSASFLGSVLTRFESGEVLDSAGSTMVKLLLNDPVSTATQGLHLRNFAVRTLPVPTVWAAVPAPSA